MLSNLSRLLEAHSLDLKSIGLGFVVGGGLLWISGWVFTPRRTTKSNPETDFVGAKLKVWNTLTGAMCASQMYLGDKLGIYSVLRDMCATPGSSVTAIDVAKQTNLNLRWIREWMAQQASNGVLILLDGEGDDDASLRYRFPAAYAEVFANSESSHYGIPMMQAVPAMVNRARTVLPSCFKTGLGVPYNDPDIAEAIDRHHKRHIRDTLLGKVIPAAAGGRVLQALERGIRVADLGCGGGNLMFALARRFPKCSVHGYEVSDEALELAKANIAQSGLETVFVHDARVDPLGKEGEPPFDVILTYDVIHDATQPALLIEQVKSALSPGGMWILGDISCRDSVRENVTQNPVAATMYAFSTCLCMSSALSEKGGAGLGTLGFGVSTAKKMVKAAGFRSVRVVLDGVDNTRWFEVME